MGSRCDLSSEERWVVGSGSSGSVARGGAMSRHHSDLLYLRLCPGSLLKAEFVPAEQRIVFRFGQRGPAETVAIAVDLIDLDRLIRLFHAAQADAKARGYLADSIMRTVTRPDDMSPP